MTNNTSALQNMLFPIVAAVTSQPMSPTEESTRQILVIGTFDSRSSNQRRQTHGVVSNESIYEEISKSLIDVLPEFLRADPLRKKVTQRLATRSQIWIKISTSAIGRSVESSSKKNLYCTFPRLKAFR